tara:strand:+ start:229 stop:528 length:300 start_codon:yes stop_codon:yes gene_type:complete
MGNAVPMINRPLIIIKDWHYLIPCKVLNRSFHNLYVILKMPNCPVAIETQQASNMAIIVAVINMWRFSENDSAHSTAIALCLKKSFVVDRRQSVSLKHF